jgi:hypothetical protein
MHVPLAQRGMTLASLASNLRSRVASVALAVAIALAASCGSRPVAPRPPKYPRRPEPATVQAEPPSPVEPELPAADPVEPRRAALLDSGEIIVGNAQGLEAWQPGGGHRVISPGPAFHPRRFGHDHVLALRPVAGFDLRDGVLLELIALANGERRELARLPEFRCAEQREPKRPNPRRLDVEDPSDFEVHAKERVVCLGLMDTVASRASVRVRVRVDLTSQRSERWLVLGETGCTPPTDVRAGDPAADGTCWVFAKPSNPEPSAGVFPFTFHEEHVRIPTAPHGGAKLQVRGYQIEEVSPSGRWLLLAGDYTERDTTYRRLVLLDRSNGRLFPLAFRPGSWPPPLSAARSKIKTPIKQAQLVPSAADVRWLGESGSELLLFDQLVIRPGGAAFELNEGEVAR